MITNLDLVQSTLHSVFVGLIVRVRYVRTHLLGFQQESDLVVKRHDSYSWYRFWTIKALVEAVVSTDGFSVICRGMVAPLIIARPLFVQ